MLGDNFHPAAPPPASSRIGGVEVVYAIPTPPPESSAAPPAVGAAPSAPGARSLLEASQCQGRALSAPALLNAAIATAKEAAEATERRKRRKRRRESQPACLDGHGGVTFYDEGAQPSVSALAPPYAAIDASSNLATVIVLGSNFAPVGGRLLCGLDGGDETELGVFLNGSAVSCLVPLPSSPGTALSISIDGGETWSASTPLTFFEPLQPPTVVSASPSSIDVSAPPGHRPLGLQRRADARLRCGFGGRHGRRLAAAHDRGDLCLGAARAAPLLQVVARGASISHDGGHHWSAKGPRSPLQHLAAGRRYVLSPRASSTPTRRASSSARRPLLPPA